MFVTHGAVDPEWLTTFLSQIDLPSPNETATKGRRKVATGKAADSHGRHMSEPTLAEAVTDGRTMGVAVHRLLGDLFASRGTGDVSPTELRRFVATHPLVVSPKIVYRQTAKQRLLVPTAIYLRLFSPGADWKFVGAEITVGRRRADLVWQREGSVMIDELKTGKLADHLQHESLKQQVTDLVAASRDTYGDRLVGVRAIVLASPRASYMVRPDGSVEALQWEKAGD